jgi:hypothetical protein
MLLQLKALQPASSNRFQEIRQLLLDEVLYRTIDLTE